MTSAPIAATGRHTTTGLPHGYTSLTPHLVVSPAARAIELYRELLSATVADVTRTGALVAHAVLLLPSGRLTLSDPLPDYELVAPGGGATSWSLAVYVPDVDATVERALAAGARLREPVSTFVSGDRFASIVDPFGVRWTIMTRVEDLSEAESAERVARWAKEHLAQSRTE